MMILAALAMALIRNQSMPTDPRTKAFIKARSFQLKRIVALDKATARHAHQLMIAARQQILAMLAGELTAFQAHRLSQLQASIKTEMDALGLALASASDQAINNAADLGSDLVTAPLAAGGITIQSNLNTAAAEQVLAIRAFTTGKIKGITSAAADDMSNQLALVLMGASNRTAAVNYVQRTFTDSRKRANRIVNTELGRAYSTAAQDRMDAAVDAGVPMQKQWRRSGKLKSRRDHDNADGQIVDANASFVIGRSKEKLRYPRDPRAHIKQTINCGCTALPYMADWPMEHPLGKPYTPEELARLGGTTA
jgi:hypothetical protein